MKRHLGLALIKEDPQLKLKLTLPNPEYRSRSIYTPYSKKEVEETLIYYKEVSDGFLVPRNYKGATAYPKVESPIIKALKFKGALRNYQKDYLKKVFSSSANEDSIFEVPCGHGKTVMAAWVICNRLQKTLILVPTNTLVEQWVQRLEEFIYGAKVSVAEASKKIVDIENSDIIIMTYELYNSKYADNEAVKEKIGQVIIDEAHRVGAQTYSPIIEELPAKYRLALSATFRRQDNTHKILEYHFGTRYKMDNQYPQPSLIKWDFNSYTGSIIKIDSKNKRLILNFLHLYEIPYKLVGDMVEVDPENSPHHYLKEFLLSAKISKKEAKAITSFCNKAQKALTFSAVDSYVSKESRRIKWAITTIKKCLYNGRCILVIAKRKDVLQKLHKFFEKRCESRLVLSKSNKNSSKFEDLLTADVIFGVSQLANEGLDVDKLDTLIMYHPISDPEQAFGRIRRFKEGKKHPTVIWPIGEFSGYDALLKKSKQYIEVSKEVTVANFKEFNNALNE